MRKLKVLLLLLAVMSLNACKNTESYPDGTYCADVTYYNPNTGTNSTYSLNVEVVDNQLTVIQWPNGGWLDSSHFSPEELDSEGECSFTSDEGNEYNIQITGSECPNQPEDANYLKGEQPLKGPKDLEGEKPLKDIEDLRDPNYLVKEKPLIF